MVLPFQTAGDGPVVVLVQGAAPAAWGTLPELLARQFTVVTYARRGFAAHPPLQLASSLREHTDDLAALLTEVGPGIVVGWSSGGVVGLDLALHRPDLVSHLVVLEAPLHARRHPTLGSLQAVLGAQLKGRRDPEAGARHFLTWALGRSDGRRSDISRLDPEELRRAAPAIVNELPHATGEREIAPRALSGLDVRTVWLVGSASQPGNAKLAQRAARRSNRVTTLRTVKGAGHAIALDAPDEVVAAVTGADASTIASP